MSFCRNIVRLSGISGVCIWGFLFFNLFSSWVLMIKLSSKADGFKFSF